VTTGKKLGIVVALEREISPLVDGWRQKTVTSGGVQWNLRESEDAAVIFVGTGSRRAYLGTKVLVESVRPEVVTSIGFAGAAAPDIAVGDVVIPAEIVRYSNGQRYRADCGRGVLATVDEVAGPEEKSHLATGLGVIAVDMEAAGVAQASQEAGRRFFAVKAISDSQSENVDLVSKFVQPEGFQTGRFVAHIAVRPQLWPTVGRLARNSSVASRALASSVTGMMKDVDAFIEQNAGSALR
jgi:nucleoside phosphorylase